MRQAEEPITKVTLNIFASDFEYLRRRGGWSTEIRWVIRAHVADQKRKAPPVSQTDERIEDDGR